MTNGKDSRTICEGGATYQKGEENSEDERPRIISQDIEACNGVIHIISEVMLP